MTINIQPDEIVSVYSGKAGECGCGCAGTYRYSKQYQALGGRQRGYDVDDKECNDRQVKRVLGILKANSDDVAVGSNNLSVVVGDRVYVIYPKPFGWK